MKSILSSALTASVLCLSACNNGAQPDDDNVVASEKTVISQASILSLKARIAEYETLFSTDNIEETYEFIPPDLRALLVDLSGLSEDAIRADITRQWSAALKTVTMESTGFDIDAAEMKLSSTGREYAVIPTKTVMGVQASPEKIVTMQSITIALMDEGTWYMARLDEPSMLDLLNRAYPDLGLENIPEAEMKMTDREMAQ